ncbi:sugar phosphate isomerase/epimerase [Paenibacillus sp. P26]|nr:sugar phosphate isomerase/epimerase [Paenibacillus sp. P26]
MKLGLSSYSLSRAIKAGEMTILDAVRWTAEHGGEHIEIVPIGFTLDDQPQLIEAIRRQAEEAGIELSNYAIAANFIQPDEASYEAEIARVQKQVDIARDLGVRLMRHDVASRPIPEATLTRFHADLEKLAEACRRVADYAASFGIVTSVENHGYYIQASDRVQELVHAVGRDNFRTTLDIGNFMCADEDSVIATKKNIGIASMVHLKDFYLRPAHRDPGKAGSARRAAASSEGPSSGRATSTCGRYSGRSRSPAMTGIFPWNSKGWSRAPSAHPPVLGMPDGSGTRFDPRKLKEAGTEWTK